MRKLEDFDYCGVFGFGFRYIDFFVSFGFVLDWYTERLLLPQIYTYIYAYMYVNICIFHFLSHALRVEHMSYTD